MTEGIVTFLVVYTLIGFYLIGTYATAEWLRPRCEAGDPPPEMVAILWPIVWAVFIVMALASAHWRAAAWVVRKASRREKVPEARVVRR